jgi:predicted alpha-1,2-mannosidase
MVRSLLLIYDWTSRLPMWANIVETNIMIGTHVDAIIANALSRGFKDFDLIKAWQAVKKNAYEPPQNDTNLLYFDREGFTPAEARAGLTSYMSSMGYVPNDKWSESASRTLDYAYDDHAASIVATWAEDGESSEHLQHRSQSTYKNIFNAGTGFFEARNSNGTWAGPSQGWCEGNSWTYLFNVMHDPTGLATLLGGPAAMKRQLDAYFNEGHNDHTNEPSHHIPYLYTAIGHPASTQRLVREIAHQNYNATPAGLSGNEDLGQMSAWYVLSAMGFYPLDPAGDEYIVSSPFFSKMTIRFPAGAATGGMAHRGAGDGGEHTLVISAPGAEKRAYVRSLEVDGVRVATPRLKHGQIVTAREILFEMAETPQDWGAS